MAGESPDKSDKKQSSGETARSERDPRLSAFRGEPAGPAKESEKEPAKESAEPERGEASEASAGTPAKAGVKAEAKAAASAEPKAEEKAEVKAAPEGEERAEATSEADADADADADTEAASGAGSDAGSEAVDKATAVFKTVGRQKGRPAEAAAETVAATSGETSGEASDAKGDGKDEAAEDDASAVDDATRVFAIAKTKGKGASAETVDQATTTFKIAPPAKGKDEAKGEGKDAPDSGVAKGPGAAKDSAAEDAPERDSERTSQFVALKSADDGSADKSLGKTAPRTPTRTTAKATDKTAGPASGPGKAAEKATDKATDKVTDKVTDTAGQKPADRSSGKAGKEETGKESGKETGKAASGKASGGAAATGILPPATGAAPAKPAAAGAGAATGAASAAGPAALPESERTKQEPLPPLDLLAKLTNTPPPAETPMRTIVRRVKIWTPLVALLGIIFVVVQSVRPLPDPALAFGAAKSSFTFEGGKLSIPWPEKGQAAVKVVGSGELGTFGEQKPVPTASVAKIMTAYVILKDHPLKKDEKGPDIEVDAKAVDEGGSESESRIEGLKAGQKFSEQDMLKMLMIPSGNNIARLLARWDTQSDNEAAFVKKMNVAAKDLGMKNTTYTDPSGLDAKTVSTAVDQLKLAEAVMKFDAFRPIVAMPNAEIPGLPERINNNNDDLLLAGLSIKGIKTGSSSAAGGTLSWAAYKTVDGKDRLILGTMMGQHFAGVDPDALNSLKMVKNNSKKVIEVVRNALTSATAVKKGQVVGYVDDGLDGLTPVVATKDLNAVGVPGQKLEMSLGDGGKTVPHEAKAGTQVGVLTVGTGASAQTVPVALQKDLVAPTFGAKLTRLG
ncbi:penicillin-binding protein PbpA [Streptomyces sp. NBRC 110611]|uniref:D-alanyl-D-alanine carboxypeptidase family protein n=1 Tax=Streptomyces sp. NBRC 110611 TaxID=1621259 RepID=UPI0008330F28|nr:D-alanyl-D-alanine carboxypeptidase [Streptomyces sp. NBRC 110611]GAU67443.1 penicillin-binding protein PbpA [Streptomyces sp. NBRC 110611]